MAGWLGAGQRVWGCPDFPLLTPACPRPLPTPPPRRQAIVGREQGVEELVLAEKVVGHLVRKEQVLMVVQQPERGEGESAGAYARRALDERVLALNPNFATE